MKRFGFLVVVTLLLTAGSAFAQSATLAVTATVTPSVSISLGSGAATLGGTATAATFAFGNVAAYGYTAPTGVTTGGTAGTNYTVTLPFNVTVTGANLTAGTYALSASTGAADPTNVKYFINAQQLATSGASTSVATGVATGTTGYTLTIDVGYAASAGAVGRTVTLTAVGS